MAPLHGSAPPYLASSFTCVANMPHRRRLRSASTEQLDVPTCRRSTIGGRAFPVAAAKVWNGLPSDVTSASSLSVFKNRLKTYLFRRCYDDDDDDVTATVGKTLLCKICVPRDIQLGRMQFLEVDYNGHVVSYSHYIPSLATTTIVMSDEIRQHYTVSCVLSKCCHIDITPHNVDCCTYRPMWHIRKMGLHGLLPSP